MSSTRPYAPQASLPVLRKRAEFLRAARARRQPMPGFMLQGHARGDDGPARIGYTCSKKVGNAVTRNRAKRRLREIARQVIPEYGRPGWDYVLIGRADATVSRDFARLKAELREALDRLHDGGRRNRRHGPESRPETKSGKPAA